MSDWQTKSSEVIYETPWLLVRKDEVIDQNGKQLTYSYVELQNPSVFIIATNEQGEIFMQSNYRYTVRRRFWEIPAGHMEAGEKPEAAAKRELLEETGLASDDWVSLGTVWQIVGTGNAPLHAFLAKNAKPANEPTDEEEDITNQQFKSLNEIESMIVDGILVDSPVIAALYMAKLHGV